MMRFIPDYTRWWPWITRWRYEKLKQENYALRDALRNLNEEIRKHRLLLGGIRAGDKAMTEAVERVLRAPAP